MAKLSPAPLARRPDLDPEPRCPWATALYWILCQLAQIQLDALQSGAVLARRFKPASQAIKPASQRPPLCTETVLVHGPY